VQAGLDTLANIGTIKKWAPWPEVRGARATPAARNSSPGHAVQQPPDAPRCLPPGLVARPAGRLHRPADDRQQVRRGAPRRLRCWRHCGPAADARARPAALPPAARSVGTEVQQAEASLSAAQQAQLKLLTAQTVSQDKSQLTQAKQQSSQIIAQNKQQALQRAGQASQQCVQACQAQPAAQQAACQQQCTSAQTQATDQAEAQAQQDYAQVDSSLAQQTQQLFSGLTSTDWEPFSTQQ
jgi:hypothetical protein